MNAQALDAALDEAQDSLDRARGTLGRLERAASSGSFPEVVALITRFNQNVDDVLEKLGALLHIQTGPCECGDALAHDPDRELDEPHHCTRCNTQGDER